MNESISADDKLLVDQVLTGKPRAVARMMSKAESGTSRQRQIDPGSFAYIRNQEKRSHRWNCRCRSFQSVFRWIDSGGPGSNE